MRSAKVAVVIPLTSRELSDLRVVRLSLDPLAASLAALNHPELEAAAFMARAELTPSADPDKWHVAHYDLHNSIWQMSGNVVLADSLRSLWSRLDRYRLLAMSDREFDHATGIEHVQIARAICARNPALAASLAAAHLSAQGEVDVPNMVPSEGRE
ncbi:MAG: FCD domain-containing protein [Candidatus Dormiibacterota bacterium]